jgi:hypothetical protein
MAKTGSISISCHKVDADVFMEILAALQRVGWSVNKNGYVVYMVDGNYELLSEPFAEYDNVLLRLKKSIDDKKHAAIDLIWTVEEAAIAVNYNDGQHLSVAIVDVPRQLPHSRIADFSWYIEKIAPIFPLLNWYRMKCLFD